MGQNLVAKYAAQIDERFKIGGLTAPAVNTDYDFAGAQTVKVFSVATSAMNDYRRTGANRYGTPSELDNTVQEMTMGRDRSFTFTVDRANDDESGGSLNAGKALRRQMDEVVTPEIDRYRLHRMAEFAGHTEIGTYTGDVKPYEQILLANKALDEKLVPREGRIAFVNGDFRVKLQLDSNFVEARKVDPANRLKGQVGEADLTPVIQIPASYLPDGVALMIVHPKATTAPQKLAEYKTHDNPPGINGVLCEGRVYYDAFVLDNKKDALYVLRSALTKIGLTSTAGASGKTILTLNGHAYDDGNAIGTLCYKAGASQAAPALGDDLSAWTGINLTDNAVEVTATAGHKIVVAARDAAGKAIGSSAPVTVVAGT